MITLYNVISVDGYIASKDGSEDFIPSSYWPHTLAVLRQHDSIVIGRKTYETIQNYDRELRDSFDALPSRKVVVTKDRNFLPKEGYEAVHSPEEAIQSGSNIVVTSGPVLNQYLLDHHLINKISYHEVPEFVGDGIKPYQKIDDSIKVVKLAIARKVG